MAFAKMIDMAKSPDDVKKEVRDVNLYPYGLCISLTEEELAKLHLDGELPDVGDTIHITGMAKVTSVSENEREDTSGEKSRSCRVELQITHLATENEDDEAKSMSSEQRAKSRYGSKPSTDEDD